VSDILLNDSDETRRTWKTMHEDFKKDAIVATDAWTAYVRYLEMLVTEARPFIVKAYREGGVPTFPNAGDWLDRAASIP